MKDKEAKMEIWNAVSRPPKEALKPITGGRLRGMTDINPQWRLKIMTEHFGPIGLGWKYSIKERWAETLTNGEVACFVVVDLFYKIGDVWSDAVIGIGGSKLATQEKMGLYVSDEGYKMALTDALSVAMKQLGVAADIYAGLWDGGKYQNLKDEDRSKTTPAKPTAKQNKILDKICGILKKKTENTVVKSKVAALFLSSASKYPSKPEFAKEAAEWLISLDRENEWTEKPKKAPKPAEAKHEPESHGTFVVDVLTSPMEAETTADPPNGTKKVSGLPVLTPENAKFMKQIKKLLIEQAVHSHLLFEARDFTKEEKINLRDSVWMVLGHWPKSKDDVLLCMTAIKPKDVIDE